MRPKTIPAVVPILLYHSVAPSGRPVRNEWQVTAADFAADMAQFARSGRVALTATTYAECLRGTRPLPPRAGLITFDDGYADFAEVAMPILDEYGFPSTLFVTSGWLGRRGMLSAGSITALAGTRTEIGAHSVTHPHLDTVPGRMTRLEATRSKDALEALVGRPVTSFAYPHGSHSASTVSAVAGAGYDTAHAVKNALSHAGDDPFAVARYTVHAGTSRAQVRAVLAGGGAPLARRRERIRTRGYRIVRRVSRARVTGPLEVVG